MEHVNDRCFLVMQLEQQIALIVCSWSECWVSPIKTASFVKKGLTDMRTGELSMGEKHAIKAKKKEIIL